MGDVDVRWVVIFLAQLAVGGMLVWFAPESQEGASTLGIALLGSAFGQGATAQLKLKDT